MLGTVTRLFRNLGQRESSAVRFEDVTVRSGLAQKTGPGLGVLCADFDGDHNPEHIDSYILLADLYLQLGQKAEAAELARQAQALNPTDRRLPSLQAKISSE